MTHFLACIIVGLLFRFWKSNTKENVSSKNVSFASNTQLTFSNLGELLANSIMNSVNTLIMIGGFVIIFSVIISIFNSSGLLNTLSTILSPIFKYIGLNTEYIQPIFSGLFELTNGLNQIVNINTKSISITITITAFLLGFGGLSILLQVLSITSKSDISIKPYIIGKLLHGFVAAILTYLFINIFPIFNLDLIPIFSTNVNKLSINFIPFSNTFIICLILVCLTILLLNLKYYKSYKN